MPLEESSRNVLAIQVKIIFITQLHLVNYRSTAQTKKARPAHIFAYIFEMP